MSVSPLLTQCEVQERVAKYGTALIVITVKLFRLFGHELHSLISGRSTRCIIPISFGGVAPLCLCLVESIERFGEFASVSETNVYMYQHYVTFRGSCRPAMIELSCILPLAFCLVNGRSPLCPTNFSEDEVILQSILV